ncbi:MAG: nucleoside triphosphate pyrophosphohydrolase [Bacteroidota bacterium]|nr:nucleoside triphosphate pyrophosphohydrolase [Bacteroidota bacterium]
MESQSGNIQRLLTIMNDLREKCPWDQKQTIDTLRQQTIEETFELVDAISGHDWAAIKEELGDLLLHIVFYSKIGSEQGQFTFEEVVSGICEKLIKRHPHVYGDVKVSGEEEVKKNWEQIKLGEGKKSVLSGVPRSLPAMVKAMRLQEKSRQVGFEWENPGQVWEKVEEEIEELKEAIQSADQSAITEETGDLLFSLINYTRFLKVDAEHALELTNRKFISRFTKMEALAAKSGHNLGDMTLEQKDGLWNEIKKSKL